MLRVIRWLGGMHIYLEHRYRGALSFRRPVHIYISHIISPALSPLPHAKFKSSFYQYPPCKHSENMPHFACTVINNALLHPQKYLSLDNKL